MKSTFNFCSVAIVLFLCLSASLMADDRAEKLSAIKPGSMIALWLRPSNGAVMEGYKCEKGYGLRIVKSPRTEFIGRSLGCAVETSTVNKLHGDMLNPYDGKTYSGYVKLIDENTLRMEGCVLFGMVCRGEEWKRISRDEFEKMQSSQKAKKVASD